MKGFTLGLLLGVVTIVLINYLSSPAEIAQYISTLTDWYKLQPQTRVLLLLFALCSFLLVIVLAAKSPGGRRVERAHCQQISTNDYEKESRDYTERQLRKMYNDPEFERKRRRLLNQKSAFEEDGDSEEEVSDYSQAA